MRTWHVRAVALILIVAPGVAAGSPSLPSLQLPHRRIGSTLSLGRVTVLRGGAKANELRPSLRTTFGHACARLANDHMRGIIFGGLDGILTTFAIMAASAGARQRPTTTLVLGLSTLLADAFSMAGGEYLSSKAEQELLSPQAASRSLTAVEPSPLEKGAAMFCAFLFFGSIPLLGFMASHTARLVHLSNSTVSVIITALALFALGALKSQFGKLTWWQSGSEVVLVGGFAATVAYTTALYADHIASFLEMGS